MEEVQRVLARGLELVVVGLIDGLGFGHIPEDVVGARGLLYLILAQRQLDVLHY